MSWELASFAVLGLVLVGGFAWYERSRPPSQVVALVAALAALAVAGRVAFAPIPNVVATTDVVIFAGYAIGAAPGFAVGALAGVVSNFWLGQGPWTPWQMAAWGLTGVLGAVLFRATRGRPNRFVLAGACGVAGIAFGALMNFSLMASYGGDLTLERFLALEARAVPFDVAHALGNVVLALIAGPAMVRMLIRFRERFEWSRAEGPEIGGRPRSGRGAAVAGATLLAVCLLASPAQGADVVTAADWLQSAQNPDGGFSDTPGESSSVAMTGWAMLGLEAAGRNPLDVVSPGTTYTPVSYLREHASSIRTTGDLARTILALSAAGVNARDFEGRNLLADLRARRAQNGSFQGFPNLTAFAILALRGGDSPRGLAHSLAWLREVQNGDGGWGDVARSPSNADTTGAVLQAVRGSRAARRAVAYLRRAQQEGGGYRLGSGGDINSQSTAWAAQGLIAGGVDPGSVRAGGRSVLDYLDARQASDGHFRYSTSSDVTPVWVTAQVLVAAAGKSFPLGVVARVKPELAPAEAKGAPATPLPAAGAQVGGAATLPGVSAASSPATPAPPPGQGAGKGPGASPSIGPLAPLAGAGGEGESAPAGDASVRADPPPEPAASAQGDGGPSPLPPVGVGVGSGMAALLGTWYLGRRRVW